MNKDSFTTMSSKERVAIVNDLLSKDGFDLQKVADTLKLNYSTFTKLMQEDDYVFIKRDNQYYKFIRDENQIISVTAPKDPELDYIKQNFLALKSLIEQSKNNNDFILDKRIFQSPKFATKNFRMSDELYKQFVKTCKEHFPQYKLQDIIAQLLFNFNEKYSKNNG
ncbi:hypothetical protein J2S13_001779 [Oikeobacillus pervagus]|uniref:Uncharacterized protein n=1 Tax=Oikeobacillus pervagus TaxID=1325931 RepID=A0AAJ1T298_9BACI|nr:hypothetical protein [Oikeobacillus pervagus]MDQ0215366.1 hypothetical protein [Oikeobacillus pervagus]